MLAQNRESSEQILQDTEETLTGENSHLFTEDETLTGIIESLKTRVRYLELYDHWQGKETGEIIAGMLRENTGKHFLDSGSAYGRNWQRNAHRVFSGEERVKLYSSEHGIECSINLYHFLTDGLDFSPGLQSLFDIFTETRPDSENWFSIIERFQDWLNETLEETGEGLTGIYGEGEPFTVNTYNHESLLSQTIQYTYFSIDGEISGEFYSGSFLILMVHGGCDVRGGYTSPKMFELSDYDGTGILRDGDLTMGSIEGGRDLSLYTDDGYHWYSDDGETVILWDIPCYTWQEYLEHCESLSPSEYGEMLQGGSYGIIRDPHDSEPFLRINGESYGKVSFDFYID